MKSTAHQIDLLCQGFELCQFKHNVPHMLECFRLFELSHAELTSLDTWSINTHTSPTLSQATGMLIQLRGLIAGLSPLNMVYFQYVKRAHQVVHFFITQTEFQKKFDLISSKYQSHAYALGKLNNMFAVFEMLEPFIEFLQGSTPCQAHSHSHIRSNYFSDQQKPRANQQLGVVNLCADVQSLFGTVEDNSDRLKQIVSVAEDFDELLVWFSQLDGLGLEAILPKISHLFQVGFFLSSSTVYVIFNYNPLFCPS